MQTELLDEVSGMKINQLHAVGCNPDRSTEDRSMELEDQDEHDEVEHNMSSIHQRTIIHSIVFNQIATKP